MLLFSIKCNLVSGYDWNTQKLHSFFLSVYCHIPCENDALLLSRFGTKSVVDSCRWVPGSRFPQAQ